MHTCMYIFVCMISMYMYIHMKMDECFKYHNLSPYSPQKSSWYLNKRLRDIQVQVRVILEIMLIFSSAFAEKKFVVFKKKSW